MIVLILVCSLAVSSFEQCDRKNAVAVLELPGGAGNQVACAFGGQAYLASTELGRDLKADETVKVLCIRPNKPGNVG